MTPFDGSDKSRCISYFIGKEQSKLRDLCLTTKEQHLESCSWEMSLFYQIAEGTEWEDCMKETEGGGQGGKEQALIHRGKWQWGRKRVCFLSLLLSIFFFLRKVVRNINM